MVAKVAVLLFAIFAVVAVSSVQGAPQFGPFVQGAPQFISEPINAIRSVASGIRDTVSDAAQHVSNGAVSTYDNQKNNVDNTIDSVKGMGVKGVESGANAVKTGINGFFIPLDFVRNTLANGRNN